MINQNQHFGLKFWGHLNEKRLVCVNCQYVVCKWINIFCKEGIYFITALNIISLIFREVFRAKCGSLGYCFGGSPGGGKDTKAPIYREVRKYNGPFHGNMIWHFHQTRPSASRVIKMLDTLWTLSTYRRGEKYKLSCSWKYDLTLDTNINTE